MHKTRLSVTLDSDTATQILKIAEQESKSSAQILRDLAKEALETREDLSLSMLADSREADTSKYLSHEEAWQ